MLKQIQPTDWSCLPTAFAIVLDVPVEHLFNLIGHDGSELPEEWKYLPHPYNRRGFHIQELIYLIEFEFYKTVTPFEAKPVSTNLNNVNIEMDLSEMLTLVLPNYSGVLTGQLARNGGYHALAWDQGVVINPSGSEIDIQTEFLISTFWRIR